MLRRREATPLEPIRCRSRPRRRSWHWGANSRAPSAWAGAPRLPQPPHRRPRPLRGVTLLHEAVEHYQRLFEVQPEVIAHDLHPDYASTRTPWSAEAGRAARRAAPSCAYGELHGRARTNRAGDRRDFDGAGYGTDGAVWGGEFLIGGYRRVPPRGPPASWHARGRQAIREPWRMACSSAGGGPRRRVRHPHCAGGGD